MTRVWQLMGLAVVAVAGLLVGVLVPSIPDSLILVLYLVAFFAILMAYSKWKDLQREREQSQMSSEAEFHRLYTRYTVARQRAYIEFLDSTDGHAGERFHFPNFAEWREDRAETN
ncbi:hypothetical protein BENNIE_37 [Arthrobacter phage Bennie]|uniref:Uncharacterized protein n=4 Tax=Korravirus bennie TaxID=1982077 RepID=A0A386K935_9CAUD|nr:hypothetical protein FDH55_gp37 [Arthrobacter phage Bennie]ALY08574.1 hypothetical protein BENNIE_37 [Arthrobacter phage Bennie]AYD81733.1 hypothetical protein Moki_37 [Arthrobacter phage Moki]AZS08178.1 hypothetical protein SEA_HUCKLEBERRY_37 [Arthrobacter phage Huckleberry]AZS12410.1 hypothetical protein SEA_HEADNERD_37 [Arthrobacter phage HeadNerd]